MNLIYKTRGDLAPQNKPNVYLCYHPKDHEKYFDIIAHEILNKHNCAIWYSDPKISNRSEEDVAELEQMQLIVLIITTDLLTTENAALNIDFKFAVAHHIPILPLMQETGLEELFNSKCGELQYLSRHIVDSTVRGYDKKLDDYLSQILIGDDFYSRISSIFSSNIFLSYRKIDRIHAQTLMRLIHDINAFRDVAIWYDEYLVPGENFNDSINTAIKECDVFVMAVTPNIVNAPNYVITTEYPQAQANNKPILPVELIKTNPSHLSKYYPGIVRSVDATKKRLLSAALHKSITRKPIDANINPIERNYLLGLAYLYGVNVEVDYKRALSIITDCANNGHLDSIDTLVKMYRNGLGVDHSYENAVKWQKIKISTIKESLNINTKTTSFELSLALCKCGDIEVDGCFYSSATKSYREALDIARSIHSNLDDIDKLQMISAIYTKLISLSELLANHISAKACCKEQIALCKRILSLQPIPQVKNRMIEALVRLANSLSLENRTDDAQLCLQQSLETLATFSAESQDGFQRDYLLLTYENLVKIKKQKNDFKEAVYYLRNAKSIAESMAAEEEKPVTLTNLVNIYLLAAHTYEAMGDSEKAKVSYESALTKSLYAFDKFKSVYLKRTLAETHAEICSFYSNNDMHKQLHMIALKAYELFSDIDKLSMLTPRSIVLFSKVSYHLYTISLNNQDYDHAKTYANNIICLGNKFATFVDNSPFDLKKIVCDGYCMLAHAYFFSHEFEDSQINYKKYIDLCGVNSMYIYNLLKSTNDCSTVITSLHDYIIANYHLGIIYSKKHDLLMSQQCYEKIAQIVPIALICNKITKTTKFIIDTCIKLGDLYSKCEQTKNAVTTLEHGLELAYKCIKTTETPENWETLSLLCFKLSELCFDKRKEYLKKCQHIYEHLVEVQPDIPRHQNNLQLVNKLLTNNLV